MKLKTRLKTLIKIIFIPVVVLLMWGATFFIPEPVYAVHLEEVNIVYKRTLKDYCLDISKRLDSLGYITVTPEEFAKFLYIVSLCESNHQFNAVNDGQYGWWQMTKETHKKLGVKVSKKRCGQANNYYKFLLAIGKTKLRKVRNSVDLHCLNFAPGRDMNGILSQVSNPSLNALDFNKDSVITREDLKLFQQKRIK